MSLPASPLAFYVALLCGFALSFHFLPCIVVRFDAQEEQKRVRERAAAMSRDSASSGPTFWLDEGKGRKLALFQDRVSAVGDFLERCRRQFFNIHKARFPLNSPIEGFRGLFKFFGSMADVRSCLRAQLVAGAQLGLSFVRVRHPDVDMDALPDLSSGTLDPRGRIDLVPHYAATEQAAKRIVHRLLSKEETIRHPGAGNLYLLPVKEEPL